jgi:hypothetical protein
MKRPEVGSVWVRKKPSKEYWNEVIIIALFDSVVNYGPTKKGINTHRTISSFLRIFKPKAKE